MNRPEARALGFEPLETRAMLAGTALEQGLAGLRQIATESRVAHQQVDTALQAAAGRVVDTMISLSQIGQQNAQELARASANVGQIGTLTTNLTNQYRTDILDLLRTGQANKIGERGQKLAQDIQSATASATSGLQKEQQDQVAIANQTALASGTTADNARAAANAHQEINSDAVSALLDIARRIRESLQSGNTTGDIGIQAIVDDAKQDFQQDVGDLNSRLAQNDAQLAQAKAAAQSKVGTINLFGTFSGEQDDFLNPNQRLTSSGQMTANVDLYPDNQILGSFRVSGLTLEHQGGATESAVDIVGTIRGRLSTTPGVPSTGTLEYSIGGNQVVLNWTESPPIYKITVDANRKITGFGAIFHSDQAHTDGSFILMSGPQSQPLP
jgi:hypothetical protein